jgi:hypothetical protein
MKKTGLLGFGRGKEDRTDYREPAKASLSVTDTCIQLTDSIQAMDELLNGCG